MNIEELLKKSKPILFNTKMVQAILEGEKTVTRRIVKIDIVNQFDVDTDGSVYAFVEQATGDSYKAVDVAPFKVGDILYVRETWNYVYDIDGNTDQCIEETGRYVYKADNDMPFDYWLDGESGEHKDKMPWKPSIHMPKAAARIFLKVTDVRVERLQNITEEEAKMEGAKKSPFKNPTMRFANKEIQKENMSESTYINGFKETWFDTLPRYYTDYVAWEGNPWVWVIGFEKLEVSI